MPTIPRVYVMLGKYKSILMSHRRYYEWIDRGGDPAEVNGDKILSELDIMERDLREVEACLQVEVCAGAKNIIEEIKVMLDFKRELESAFNEVFGSGTIPVGDMRTDFIARIVDDRLV